jgi:hypothetical protein
MLAPLLSVALLAPFFKDRSGARGDCPDEISEVAGLMQKNPAPFVRLATPQPIEAKDLNGDGAATSIENPAKLTRLLRPRDAHG